LNWLLESWKAAKLDSCLDAQKHGIGICRAHPIEQDLVRKPHRRGRGQPLGRGRGAAASEGGGRTGEEGGGGGRVAGEEGGGGRATYEKRGEGPQPARKEEEGAAAVTSQFSLPLKDIFKSTPNSLFTKQERDIFKATPSSFSIK
jgi:hypothetical protein